MLEQWPSIPMGREDCETHTANEQVDTGCINTLEALEKWGRSVHPGQTNSLEETGLENSRDMLPLLSCWHKLLRPGRGKDLLGSLAFLHSDPSTDG